MLLNYWDLRLFEVDILGQRGLVHQESLHHMNIIKVPLLWVMKGSYFVFGSPQQQTDMHARSKNTFIFL